jgi:MarR-like DNA-binding transcriptional regulator SgrR of sgrS sRNA
MSDILRLPGIPIDDHPATHREKLTHDVVQEMIRGLERNRFTLLTIVLGGKEKWRRHAQSIMAGLRIGEDHQMLDAIFSYLELLACAPRFQRRLLDAKNNPQQWKDIMREALPDLEAQREAISRIERGWPA